MLALSLAASFALCADAPRNTCVVDGDTFWLAGEKIRIADINAPETQGAACPAERAQGEAAKRRLLILLNAGPFDLLVQGRPQDRSMGMPTPGGGKPKDAMPAVRGHGWAR